MPVISDKDIIFDAPPANGRIVDQADIVFDTAQPEDSWPKVIGKGLMQGAAGTARGIGELMSLPGRALGYSGGVWDYVRKAGKEAEEYWKPEVPERGAKHYVGEAARTIGHMGSAAASGGATRILPALSSLSGATKAGEILDEGHPVYKALIGGLTQAGLEYATEKMPMDILLKPGVNFLSRLGKGMMYDIPGELAATAGEMAMIDQHMLGKNYSAEQYKQALIDTAIVAGLVTGGATTISHPLVSKKSPATGRIIPESDIVFEDTGADAKKGVEQPLSAKDKLIQEIYDKANAPLEDSVNDIVGVRKNQITDRDAVTPEIDKALKAGQGITTPLVSAEARKIESTEGTDFPTSQPQASNLNDLREQFERTQEVLQKQKELGEMADALSPEKDTTVYNDSQARWIKGLLPNFEGSSKLYDEGQVAGRTKSDRPKWLQLLMADEQVDTKNISSILGKAINKQPLTEKQQRVLDRLMQDGRADYEKVGRTEVVLDDMQEGDKFIVDGETFVHKGHDEEGNAVIKDGITYKVPMFSREQIVEVDEFVPAEGQEQQKTGSTEDVSLAVKMESGDSGTVFEKRTGAETRTDTLSVSGADDTARRTTGSSNLNIPPSAENAKEPKKQEQADQAVSEIISEIERIAAPGTKVEIVDAVDTTDSELRKGFKSWGLETSDAGKIRGLHRVVRTTKGELQSLIQLVSGKMNPETTPYHEAFHSVQRFLLTDEESSMLKERFPDKDGVSSKERQADAFAQYAKGRKSYPVWVRNTFEKIKSFIDSVRNFVQGKGWSYKDVTDIFDRVYTGELKQRKIRATEQQGSRAADRKNRGTEERKEKTSNVDLDIEQSGDQEKPRLAIDMPEIVEIAKELSGGKYPRIKEALRALQGNALGVFYSGGKKKGTIAVRADLFRNPELAKSVLAHEVGHLIDYVPDETLKRGNILGRIASLKKYMKHMLGEMPDSQDNIITAKERNEIRNKATKEVLEEHGKKLKDFFDDKDLRDSLRPEIGSRTKKMINEIAEERGLFSKQEITDELKALTKEWRPFDPAVDEKYTKYRHSPKELYADALSVMINNPELLQEKAPRFTKALFNWMERKPEVKTLYDDIQDRIGNPAVDVTEKRTENVKEMFKEGEERKLEQIDRKKPVNVLGDIKRVLADVNEKLIQRIDKLKKQGRQIPAEDNPLYWIEELPYISGEVYNHLQAIDNGIKAPAQKAGITVDDIGEYMFFKRVATERADIANPLGHYKESAEKQLEDLESRLGNDRYSKLEGYVNKYWELRQKHVFPLLEQAGMYSGKLMDKVLNNEHYATFDIIKSLEGQYGRGVTGHIYKQIGTLHEVRNPFVATIMKDAALIRAANTNMAKEKAIKFLEENFPDEIQKSDTRWNGKYQEPVMEPKNPDEQGTITIMKDGKVQAYYAPKDIADNFKRAPYEAKVILKAWQTLNIPLRAVLVSHNPLWMLGNIIRDMMATYKQVPGMTAAKVIKYYSKALGDAYRDVAKGKETETVNKMLKGKMLVLDRHYGTIDMPAETELDRMLQSYGQSPARHRNMVIKPMLKVVDFLGALGKFTERVPKIAGYKYLKENYPNMSEKEVAHIVRTRAGTPDPYRRGAWHSLTNSIFLFSNIAKEGYRSSWESYKENKAGYIWKTVKVNVLPRLALFAAAAGALGDELEEIIRGISDYDKENYTIIPLGRTDSGKSVYLRIPQDFTGQVMGGVLWNLMNMQLTGKGGLLAYGAEQQPYGLNPYLTVASDWIQYLSGRNPYDAFYGKYIVPERVFKAGGMKSHQKMLENTSNELGGSVIHRFKGDSVDAAKSDLEKALGTFPGTIPGKFLKISDQGIRGELRKITDKAGAKEAGRQLEVRDRIMQSVNKATDEGRKPIVSDMVHLYRDLVKDELIDASITNVMNFRYMYNRYASRSEGSPYVDAVINAGSNAEKAALLSEYEKKFGKEKYLDIVRQLMIEGHISKGALVRKLKDEMEAQ